MKKKLVFILLLLGTYLFAQSSSKTCYDDRFGSGNFAIGKVASIANFRELVRISNETTHAKGRLYETNNIKLTRKEYWLIQEAINEFYVEKNELYAVTLLPGLGPTDLLKFLLLKISDRNGKYEILQIFTYYE